MRFAILNPPSSRCSGRERMAPPARHEGTPISIFPSPMKTMFMDAELASEPWAAARLSNSLHLAIWDSARTNCQRFCGPSFTQSFFTDRWV